MDHKITYLRIMPGISHSAFLERITTLGDPVIDARDSAIYLPRKLSAAMSAIAGSNPMELVNVIKSKDGLAWSPVLSWALSLWRQPAFKGRTFYVLSNDLLITGRTSFQPAANLNITNILIRMISAKALVDLQEQEGRAPMSKQLAMMIVNYTSIISSAQPYNRVINQTLSSKAVDQLFPLSKGRISTPPEKYSLPVAIPDSVGRSSLPPSVGMDKYTLPGR